MKHPTSSLGFKKYLCLVGMIALGFLLFCGTGPSARAASMHRTQVTAVTSGGGIVCTRGRWGWRVPRPWRCSVTVTCNQNGLQWVEYQGVLVFAGQMSEEQAYQRASNATSSYRALCSPLEPVS